ncbi:hypothetical protein KAR91_18850 [Candidatus Pacearchaeota archaeon]|nr:hypothetical protein [Candidatus Pacearchaeota archaeon]
MATLSRGDLQLVVSRLPKDVVTLMKERGIILGGGFIRAAVAGEKPSDIDLFGSSKDQLEAAARSLNNDREGSRFFSSDNAYTVLTAVRMPVQFIHRWVFPTASQCVESFDFTIAKAVVWYTEERKWQSACARTFYQDLAARRLVYCSPDRNEDAGGSLLRVRKFLARGYNIQAASLAAVIARLCTAIEWDKVDSEHQTAEVIKGLLHEVDPLRIVDGIDVIDEHEALTES